MSRPGRDWPSSATSRARRPWSSPSPTWSASWSAAASTRSSTAPTRPAWCRSTIDAIGAAYYTGNCHKWLCGPKGAAFLHVRRDRQAGIRPLVISHGANSPRADRSRFRLEFDWTGTADPTAFLSLPAAIRFLGSLSPGGWPGLMEANQSLARAGRDLLCQALDVEAPAPDEMLGSMAAVPLPLAGPAALPPGAASLDAALFDTYHIEVPITAWPVDAVEASGSVSPARFVRISAQRYNDIGQYAALADALREMFGSG